MFSTDNLFEMTVIYYFFLRFISPEQVAVERLTRSASSQPYLAAEINAKYIGSLDPNRYILGKYENEKPGAKRYTTEERVTRRSPFRTDFKIHPEWVP